MYLIMTNFIVKITSYIMAIVMAININYYFLKIDFDYINFFANFEVTNFTINTIYGYQYYSIYL